MGGSVNDLILAICAGAIRRYLAEKEKLPLDPLVANVPISIRNENSTEMNNQIANMMIQLATHIQLLKASQNLINLAAFSLALISKHPAKLIG